MRVVLALFLLLAALPLRAEEVIVGLSQNKSGVIRKPPPTPNMPDSTPTPPPTPSRVKAFTDVSAMGR